MDSFGASFWDRIIRAAKLDVDRLDHSSIIPHVTLFYFGWCPKTRLRGKSVSV